MHLIDINVHDDLELTLLHLIDINVQDDIELTLLHLIDINVQDDLGLTLLHLIDINVQDDLGLTLLNLPCKSYNIGVSDLASLNPRLLHFILFPSIESTWMTNYFRHVWLVGAKTCHYLGRLTI